MTRPRESSAPAVWVLAGFGALLSFAGPALSTLPDAIASGWTNLMELLGAGFAWLF
jgi:hypothetical protein